MNLLNREYWIRALRDPLVIAGLLVDLLPIAAVLVWGWGAGALVVLYWAENVLIGIATIPRIILASARFGAASLAGGVFMAAFFAFHYGMFCLAHGIFIMSFFEAGDTVVFSSGNDVIGRLAKLPFAAGEHMLYMIFVIAAWQVVMFFMTFVARGEWRETTSSTEMGAPYGRVVVLHFGLFFGAAAVVAVGDPMVGVLALIILRALWGIWSASRRSFKMLGLTNVPAA